jgi:hypothetical protein
LFDKRITICTMDLPATSRRVILFNLAGILALIGNQTASSSYVGPSVQTDSAGVNELAASSGKGETFSNQFLTISILPAWKASFENQTLVIVHGKYTLTINPMFTHASGVIGGRFLEIVAGMPSVDAVMHNVDFTAGGFDCWQTDKMVVTGTMSLVNLYTDKSKTGHGCVFPLDSQPAWCGSYLSGHSSESDYTITLAYEATDVNKLPKRNSQKLRVIFRDVVAMLKTLSLKPPVLISRVDPKAAPPGTTITVYGSGFRIGDYRTNLMFREFPNNSMPSPNVAPDGNSLTFVIPSSINTVSCQPGRIDVNGYCIPTPADHVDINDCPHSTDFCGVPIPPGTYHIMVNLDATGISSNTVDFTVTPPPPTRVSILLLYPNYLVSPGDMVTVRGSGFTLTDNTVVIGSVVVRNLPSVDGKTIKFRAPQPAGEGFIPGNRIYRAFVSNSIGKSNSISFDYR